MKQGLFQSAYADHAWSHQQRRAPLVSLRADIAPVSSGLSRDAGMAIACSRAECRPVRCGVFSRWSSWVVPRRRPELALTILVRSDTQRPLATMTESPLSMPPNTTQTRTRNASDAPLEGSARGESGRGSRPATSPGHRRAREPMNTKKLAPEPAPPPRCEQHTDVRARSTFTRRTRSSSGIARTSSTTKSQQSTLGRRRRGWPRCR
jgi:hypothetical protein